VNIKLKKYCIHKNTTIKNALKSLDISAYKCLLVTEKNSKLIGTLTDGDLRRAIISGKSINNKITNYFNKKPKFVFEKKFNQKSINQYFKKDLINILPVVDKNLILKDIIKVSDLLNNKEFKNKKNNFRRNDVVIMAGGFGKRLKPFTDILPKPLIPLNNKPLIDHIIDNFKIYGFNNFTLTTHYKNEILNAFFRTKNYKNLNIIFEKKPLGTIGALSNLNKISENFFVSNCDTIIKTNYQEILDFHKKDKNIATIVSCIKKYTLPYGDCKFDENGNFIRILEKPSIEIFANTGFYVFNKSILNYIQKNKYIDAPELFKILNKNNCKVGVYPIEEKYWLDTGQWKEFFEASKII